eukprot:4851759-Prymnesium_polylepis.1
MSKAGTAREELAAQLEALESAAGGQLDQLRAAADEEGAGVAQMQRLCSDLELFVEFGAKQRAKHIASSSASGA